jgi:hypothetical protein
VVGAGSVSGRGSFSFPQKTTCPASRANNGGRRGVARFLFFCGLTDEGVLIAVPPAAPFSAVASSGTPSLGSPAAWSVGGAGIRRDVAQAMHVYVMAWPCEDDAGNLSINPNFLRTVLNIRFTRTVAVRPGVRTSLQPLQTVRFTVGSLANTNNRE